MYIDLAVPVRYIRINHEGLYLWTPQVGMRMNRSAEIEPMVPEMPTTSVRADGGEPVAAESHEADGAESEAPLVPDLS
jgi:hypothetical protein